MKRQKRAQRWSVLLLIIGTTVIMGQASPAPFAVPPETTRWPAQTKSVHPMPQQFPALPPGIALAKLTEPVHSPLDAGDGSDFLDPLRFPARPPAERPVAKTENPERHAVPAVLPGRTVRLDPTGSLNVPPSGRIEFIVTLTNLETKDWQVIGELYVTKGDGTTEKLFGPRAIRLGPTQRLRLPVGFAANPKRFPPGSTQFLAVLKDQSGKAIDQAIITFSVELGQ